MNIDVNVWRVWLTGNVTLHELDTYWTMSDLFDANEALDLKNEVEEFYANNKEDKQ